MFAVRLLWLYYSYCYAGQDSRPGGCDKQMGETSKQSKHENGNQDGYGAPVSDNSIPLQTTPELFATITEVFVPKEIIPKLDYRRMDFDPAISPAYIPCVELLKASRRRLNTTTADGNCLFRSLSKALLGTENFHYRIRTTLFGFIYLNSKFFLPHIEQRYESKVEYCLEMEFGVQMLNYLLQLPCFKHLYILLLNQMTRENNDGQDIVLWHSLAKLYATMSQVSGGLFI